MQRCDFGLLGSNLLIFAIDTPRLSCVRSRIDPNKHDGWLQIREWGLRRRRLHLACCFTRLTIWNIPDKDMERIGSGQVI